MKKLLTFLTALTVVSLPINVVSCISEETRDRTKISLALFKSELALVPFFETATPTKTITEAMFQDAIYGALETNEYRGKVASEELRFIYYNQDLAPVSWTNLIWKPVTKGGEKTPLLWVKIIANSNSRHFANQTEIISTTLYKTTPLALDTIKFNYVEEMVKNLSVDEMMAYFAVLNPTFYFSARHFAISKTANSVIIKALPTSERYRGENIISF